KGARFNSLAPFLVLAVCYWVVAGAGLPRQGVSSYLCISMMPRCLLALFAGRAAREMNGCSFYI
ncbi:hypothetical protein, partial [Pseudomonas carnis]|uniref:hypothetical protein n=1 Tax=Pseudomonas carnis TaxID=2487355 RepID=UPI00244C596F